ncbi:MAG: hypothetical protein HY649_07410 [Acidobacteria bacterium]|nr:hypothetical protein [Acidobacteriota bacterium]
MPTYYNQLYNPVHLQLAWKKISKSNKFSHGFDDVTIQQFATNLEENLQAICRDLKYRTFRFTPARGLLVQEDSGKKRPIKVPAVRDRVVLKAVESLIYPKFCRYNLPCSYGYIHGRSVKDAVDAVRKHASNGFVWVLEGDISKFFDKVNQELLINRFIREIRVKSLIALLSEALRVEIGNPERFTPEDRELFPASDSGIPQGGILSPMLANFYLYPFDKALSEAGFNLVRYADDFVVMCNSRKSAEKAYQLCRKVLEDRLKLKLHPLEEGPGSKTKITLFSKGFTFLGIRFEGQKVFPSSKAIGKFRTKIEGITDARQGQNLLNTLNKLRNLLLGWGNAYHSYDTATLFQELDSFVRQSVSSYLQKNGFLSSGHILGKHQSRILGLPSLVALRPNSGQ